MAQCLVTKLNLVLSNPNLPTLDFHVEDYIAALGDNTYSSEISTLYNTLKTGGITGDIDVLMPILGTTVDKAMLNLMDTTKKIGYNSNIQVGDKSLYATSEGTRVAGDYYESTDLTAADRWGIVIVFKRNQNSPFGKITKMGNLSYIIGQVSSTVWSPLGNHINFAQGEVGNAYLASVWVGPYAPTPDDTYNKTYMLGTDTSKKTLSPNGTISPANTFEAPITFEALSEVLFFMLVRNVHDEKMDIILPAVKTFVEATKSVTFAPNPS